MSDQHIHIHCPATSVREEALQYLREIHGYVHAIGQDVTALKAQVQDLQKQGVAIMAGLDALKAEIAAEDTVIQSAIVAFQGVAAQIAALTPDQAAIDALAADVHAQASHLAAAIVTIPDAPATP